MIVHLKTTIGHDEAKALAQTHQAILTQNTQWHKGFILTMSSKVKELPAELTQFVEDYVVLDSDIQFASRSYQDRKAEVRIAEQRRIELEKQTTDLIEECRRHDMNKSFIEDLQPVIKSISTIPTFRQILLDIWTPIGKPKASSGYDGGKRWIMNEITGLQSSSAAKKDIKSMMKKPNYTMN